MPCILLCLNGINILRPFCACVHACVFMFSYNILDGYPASLGFPIMHRVHVICIHPCHNCHDIKYCHPPDKQYTEFIINTCSLFFICNNKVAMARARCGIGCEYTVYSGYLP